MAKLLFVLFAMSLASYARAEVSCSGYLNIPGGFLNGNCNGGSCSAFLPSDFLSGSGNCGSEGSMQVRGNRSGGFANAQCNGGSISLFLQGGEVTLEGTCPSGQPFSGYAQLNGGFANGSCQENGSFNIFLPGEEAYFTGSCR